jgi:hypothetical protein
MKARDLFEFGAAPAAPPRPTERPVERPGVRPSAPPAPGRFPSPSRRKFPGKREDELPKPKLAHDAAPAAPPKQVPRTSPPPFHPGVPTRPGQFPSPSRRKFPGKREDELPKPKADVGAAMPGSLPGSYAPSTSRYESRASLIVKKLLA